MNVRAALIRCRPSALANNFGFEAATIAFESNGNPASLKVPHASLAKFAARCFELGIAEGANPTPRDFPAAEPPEDFHDERS